MKHKRFSDEQVIGVLKEHEAGAKVDDICRRHAISSATFYTWRKKYGGMEASDAKRLRELGAENAKLKRIVADQVLDMSAMKELLEKHWQAHGEEKSRGLSDDGERAQRAAGLPDHRPRPLGAAISTATEERRGAGHSDEGASLGEPALWLSAPACDAASRRARPEPQADLPPLHGRGPAGPHEETTKAASPGSHRAPGAGTADAALVHGFRERPVGRLPAVQGPELRR